MGIGAHTLKHALIYSAAEALGSIAGFVMLPFYAHMFSTEGYGVMAMLDTSMSIFVVLLAGGFQTAIMRTYHGRQDGDKKAVLGTGIRLVWALSALMVTLPLVFSVPLSGLLLGSREHWSILCLALLTFVIDVAGQSATTVQIIKQKSLLFSVVTLIRVIVGLALNIWLVVVLRMGLIGFFISALVAATMSSLTFHVLAARERVLGFDRLAAVEILRFQLPLLPGDIVTFMGRQAERIMVRVLIGIEGMGVLEMAYKFPPLLITFISIPFSRAWNTKCLEIAEQDGGAGPTIVEMFERYLFVLIFAGMVMALSIHDVLTLLTPPEFWDAARIVRIEVVTTILGACASYLSFGILYRRQTGIISRIRMTLVPFKIAIAFALISAFGLLGAAYSALIIEAVALTWITARAQQLYHIPLDYRRIGVIVAAAAGLFLVLDGNTYSDFPPAIYAREHWLAELISYIGSVLGAIEGNAFVQAVQAKLAELVSLSLNLLFSLAFLALLPLLLRQRHRSTP